MSPGSLRPPCRQPDRTIDWQTEPTEAVLARLRAADSSPGVLDQIGDTEYYLFGGHPEDELRGQPGTILARRNGAICRATADGAVWIPQLRRRPAPGGPGTFKLPATLALRTSPGGELDGVPVLPAPLTLPPGRRTYRQISYRESGAVGYLEFSFPGGAMSTGQCRSLLAAYRHAQARPVKVIVLGGAPGLLRQRHPPERDPGRRRSRRGVLAEHQRHRRPGARDPDQHRPAHRGGAGRERRGRRPDAGAGRRPGVVPVRRGPQPALPPDGPARLGILDLHPAPPRGRPRGGPADRGLPAGHSRLGAPVRPRRPRDRRRRRRLPRAGGGHGRAPGLAAPPTRALLAAKARQLAAPEQHRPLAAYRAAELAVMARNFFDPREPYAELRRAFVYKEKPSHTPPHLARHRTHSPRRNELPRLAS